MTREQDLRQSILRHLYALRPLHIGSDKLRVHLRRSGYDDVLGIDVIRECDFLAGSDLVERGLNPMSGETWWKITSRGILRIEEEQSSDV